MSDSATAASAIESGMISPLRKEVIFGCVKD
jgi:hypothetical protein